MDSLLPWVESTCPLTGKRYWKSIQGCYHMMIDFNPEGSGPFQNNTASVRGHKGLTEWFNEEENYLNNML